MELIQPQYTVSFRYCVSHPCSIFVVNLCNLRIYPKVSGKGQEKGRSNSCLVVVKLLYIILYETGVNCPNHKQTSLTVRVRPRDVMKFTRSVIPYIYCNLQHMNMGLINKVDMVCLSPVGYGV